LCVLQEMSAVPPSIPRNDPGRGSSGISLTTYRDGVGWEAESVGNEGPGPSYESGKDFGVGELPREDERFEDLDPSVGSIDGGSQGPVGVTKDSDSGAPEDPNGRREKFSLCDFCTQSALLY